MTKRERFLNVIAGKPVDRVPVAFFHHFCAFADFGKGLADESIFEQNIEGHRKARAVFDPDIIKIMNDSLMIMPLDVSFVNTAADLRKVEPLSRDSTFVQKSLELTKRSRAFYEDSDAPVFATSFSPTFVLRNSLMAGGIAGGGDETKIKQFAAEDPEAFSAAVQTISEGISELNHLLVTEGGVDGVYLSVNNQANFFEDDFYLRYIAPHEKTILDNANKIAEHNLLHVCGFAGRANNLALFKEYNAAAYNWAVHAEGVSLSEGKKLFGGKAVFGGFEQAGVIYKGSREDLQAATFAILDECGQTGIMLGADCTVPNDIDDNRLEWVRQAAIQYASQ